MSDFKKELELFFKTAKIDFPDNKTLKFYDETGGCVGAMEFFEGYHSRDNEVKELKKDILRKDNIFHLICSLICCNPSEKDIAEAYNAAYDALKNKEYDDE